MPKAAARPRLTERFRLKYRRLRRAAQALIFENGALCDEVARLEAKWLRARDERRFLLARLLQLRAGDAAGDPPAESPRRPRRAGAKDGTRATAARARGSRDGQRDEARSAGVRDGPRAVGSRDDSWPTGPRPVGSRDDVWPTGSRLVGSRPCDGAAPRPNGLRDGARPLEEPRDDLKPNGAPVPALRAPEDPSVPPAAILGPGPRRRPFGHPEDEEDDEDDGNEDDDDDDEDDEEEEEEEEEATPAFGYADIFLGSPTGSDE